MTDDFTEALKEEIKSKKNPENLDFSFKVEDETEILKKIIEFHEEHGINTGELNE